MLKLLNHGSMKAKGGTSWPQIHTSPVEEQGQGLHGSCMHAWRGLQEGDKGRHALKSLHACMAGARGCDKH